MLENSCLKLTPEVQMKVFKAHCITILLNSHYGVYLLTTAEATDIDYRYKMTSWALVLVGAIFIASICFII